MIKLRELNLRTIRKMTMRHRLQAINEVNRSALSYTMFSMMTPTQFAELFPRYYRQHNPDIQGFMNALPSSLTQAQQKAREAQLAQTASGSAGGSDFNSRGYVQEYKEQMTRERSAHVGGRGGRGGRGGPPPATLSPEQDKAFSYIQSGDMDVGSDIMKNNFGKLSDKELNSIGITKITKEGKEYYHYNKPEMSDEQATARLKEGGSKVDKILDVISGHESGGKNIKTNISGQSASGHFQFTDGTWQTLTRKFGIGTEYSSAMSAPADVQRSVAKKYVSDILERHKGDVSWVPREWYGGQKGYLTEHELEVNKGVTMDQYISRWMNRYSQSGGGTQSEPAKGENGQYSREQLDKVKEQYAKEQNQAQRQKYAEVLRSHGVDPETGGAQGSVSYGKSKDFSSYILGTKGNCQVGARTMATHMFGHTFDPGGNADDVGPSGYYQKSGFFKNAKMATRDDLSNQAYLDSLPIGTVISVGGGKAGHVQVKIAANRWASDFDQGNRVLLHRGNKDGHGDYDGKFYVSIPNQAGLERLRQNGVDQNYSETAAQKAEAVPNEGQKVNSKPAERQNDKDQNKNAPPGNDGNGAPVNQPKEKIVQHATDNVPEGAHVKFDQKTGRVEQKSETKVTVQDKKPAEAKPVEPKPEAPKVPEGSHVKTDLNPKRVDQKPESKVTVTPPEKKAEVKPPEAPKPKSDTAKVEPAKPEPQKTAEAPKPAEPQKVAENKPTEKPKTPTQTAAKGGKFNADTKNLSIAPIGGLTKGGMTDTAVLMAGNRPVSTLNPNRETVSARNNQVSIQPVGKESKLNPPAEVQNSTPDSMRSEPPTQQAPMPQKPMDNNRDTNLIDNLLKMSKQEFRSPSFARACSRANSEESKVDGWDHYSLGNANFK